MDDSRLQNTRMGERAAERRPCGEDQLWYSFFHEAAHILLHRKRTIFLEGVNGLQDEEEAQADQFASDFLIPYTHHNQLKMRLEWAGPETAAV